MRLVIEGTARLGCRISGVTPDHRTIGSPVGHAAVQLRCGWTEAKPSPSFKKQFPTMGHVGDLSTHWQALPTLLDQLTAAGYGFVQDNRT